MRKLFSIICVVMLFVACEEQKPADVKMVRETKGSIFTTIQTKHVGNVDIRCTTDTIHNDFGVIVKVIAHIDTIPQLALTRDTLATGKTYVNTDGDEVERDTVIVHPKVYQMYISVKN